FYKYFYETKRIRFSYLLLTVFASYLWVSYIRFIQIYLIVIIPYIVYFYFQNKHHVTAKKSIVFILSNLLLFSPIIYSFISQLLEGSQTAFNYGNILGRFVVQYEMYQAFNLFQSIA